MKRLVAGLVVIALAIAALWWWRSHRGAARAPAVASGSGGSGSAGRAGSEGPAGAGRSRTRIDPATVARASISGRITTDAQQPVAGAQVCARGGAYELDAAMFREPSCATTDARGAYAIEKLVPARYVVSADAATYRPATYHPGGDRKHYDVVVAAGERRTGVDITLRGGGVQVSGTVSDLTGGPIARARVSATAGRWGSGDRGNPVETDDAGHFTLWTRPGAVTVMAGADGYTDHQEDGRAPGTVDLLLTPESSLAGIVIDGTTAAPVPGAQVTVGTIEYGYENGETVTSDAEGKFRVARLDPGRVVATARTEHAYGRSDGSSLVGLGQSVEGVVVKVFPAFQVSGTVVNAATKQPCDQPWVRLNDSTTNRDASLEQRDDKVSVAIGVLPGTYQVTVWCEGAQARATLDPVVVVDKDVTGLVWEIPGGAGVTGRVLTADQQPVEDAQIVARTVGGDARAKSDYAGDRSTGDGTYALTGLRAGSLKIDVMTDRGVAAADGYPVTVPATGIVHQDLVLEAGGTITGTVADSAGHPVAGVTVDARANNVMRYGGQPEVKTDSAGAFSIESLKPGDYRVLARRGWAQELRKPGTTDDARQGEKVTVRARQTATVKLVVESETGSITGSVRDLGGGPVTDAYVTATRESDAAGASAGAARAMSRWFADDSKPVLTSTAGTFALAGLAPGSYTVRAYRKGGGETLAEHVAVGTTGVTLQMKATGSIAGTVKRPAGDPVELTITVVDAAQGLERTERFFMTAGRFAVKDLPAGHFRVTAEAIGGTKVVEVALAEGEAKQGVAIELDALVTLTGRVVDAATKQPVPGMHMMATLASAGSSMQFSFGDEEPESITGDDGRFVLKNAPRGKLSLSGFPKDYDTSAYTFLRQTKVVDGTGTIELGDLPVQKRRVKSGDPVGTLGVSFVEQPPETEPDQRKLEVSFIQPDGAAAKSELKVGDVITSIDGTDVTGDHVSQAWGLMQAPPGTKLALGLARGATVTVTLAAP